MRYSIIFIAITLASYSIAQAQPSKFITNLKTMVDSVGLMKTISILDSTVQILFNSTPDTIHENEIWYYSSDVFRIPAPYYSSNVDDETSTLYTSRYLLAYYLLWYITQQNTTLDSFNFYYGRRILTDSNRDLIFDYVLCPSNTKPIPDRTYEPVYDTVNHKLLLTYIHTTPRTLIPNPKLETQFKQMKTAYNTWISLFYKEGLAGIRSKKISILPDGYTWEEF